MTDDWTAAARAWVPWRRWVAHELSHLPRGDAMFVCPLPSDPRAWPLSGPSLRIFRWGDGNPIVVGRLPDRPDAADIWGPLLDQVGWGPVRGIRFAASIEPGEERRAALAIWFIMEHVYGCPHPSFVRVGGADVGEDATLWEETVKTRLAILAHNHSVRWRQPSSYERYGGDQLSLLSPTDLDPTTPTLWD